MAVKWVLDEDPDRNIDRWTQATLCMVAFRWCALASSRFTHSFAQFIEASMGKFGDNWGLVGRAARFPLA